MEERDEPFALGAANVSRSTFWADQTIFGIHVYVSHDYNAKLQAD